MTKMSETRRIVGHAAKPLAGPHRAMPAGFTPLLLKLDADPLCVEFACPDALLGRHSASDFRIAFPEVSRRHCRVVFENGVWHIYDLNSLNGVYVNGEKVRDAILYTGDHLFIGCVNFRVVAGTAVRATNAQDETLRQIAERVV
jgi:hypothetical protein